VNVISGDKLRLLDMRAAPARSRRAIRTVVVAATLLVLVACSDGHDGDAQPGRETTTTSAPETSSTTSTATTVSLPASPEAIVLADHNAAKAALEEAERLADPDYPPLAEHWVGDLLTEIRKQLLILKTNGWVIRGTTTHNPKVVTVDAGTAVVRDCIHTDGERYDVKTGAVVDPTGPLTVGYEETLTRQDAGAWKIAARVKQEQACTAS
jgi:hypothetical protein